MPDLARPEKALMVMGDLATTEGATTRFVFTEGPYHAPQFRNYRGMPVPWTLQIIQLNVRAVG